MAKTSGRRKHGTKKPEYQSYIFRVDNPEVSYSLAIDRNGWAEGPYREHLELNVRGTMVVPERLQGRQGTLTFLGDRRIANELHHPIESRPQPIAVGSLTVRGERTSYLGSLPHDAFWHLGALLSRNDIQMLALHGEMLSRGNAKILTVHFEREIDLTEW
jgi:hypothetical protein